MRQIFLAMALSVPTQLKATSTGEDDAAVVVKAIFKDEEHPEVVTVGDVPTTAAKKAPLSSSHIATQTFIASSIANEEKLFFTNFHNAAQQLSLLGINAVGLATQIQAIRGHIMMLQLIDGHIDTLTKDHERYTELLTEAHKQLRDVTGVPDKAPGQAVSEQRGIVKARIEQGDN